MDRGKIPIETANPVNIGTRDVQLLRDQARGLVADTAEMRLRIVQDFQQCGGLMFVMCADLRNHIDIVRHAALPGNYYSLRGV